MKDKLSLSRQLNLVWILSSFVLLLTLHIRTTLSFSEFGLVLHTPSGGGDGGYQTQRGYGGAQDRNWSYEDDYEEENGGYHGEPGPTKKPPSIRSIDEKEQLMFGHKLKKVEESEALTVKERPYFRYRQRSDEQGDERRLESALEDSTVEPGQKKTHSPSRTEQKSSGEEVDDCPCCPSTRNKDQVSEGRHSGSPSRARSIYPSVVNDESSERYQKHQLRIFSSESAENDKNRRRQKRRLRQRIDQKDEEAQNAVEQRESVIQKQEQVEDDGGPEGEGGSYGMFG